MFERKKKIRLIFCVWTVKRVAQTILACELLYTTTNMRKRFSSVRRSLIGADMCVCVAHTAHTAHTHTTTWLCAMLVSKYSWYVFTCVTARVRCEQSMLIEQEPQWARVKVCVHIGTLFFFLSRKICESKRASKVDGRSRGERKNKKKKNNETIE